MAAAIGQGRDARPVTARALGRGVGPLRARASRAVGGGDSVVIQPAVGRLPWPLRCIDNVIMHPPAQRVAACSSRIGTDAVAQTIKLVWRHWPLTVAGAR